MRGRKIPENVGLSDIVQQLERIERDVQSLTRQTERLCARIRPYQYEPEPPPRDEDLAPRRTTPKGLPEIYAQTRHLAECMDAPLHHLRLIAARIDQIYNSSWSRDDLRDHMQVPPPRKVE